MQEKKEQAELSAQKDLEKYEENKKSIKKYAKKLDKIKKNMEAQNITDDMQKAIDSKPEVEAAQKQCQDEILEYEAAHPEVLNSTAGKWAQATFAQDRKDELEAKKEKERDEKRSSLRTPKSSNPPSARNSFTQNNGFTKSQASSKEADSSIIDNTTNKNRPPQVRHVPNKQKIYSRLEMMNYRYQHFERHGYDGSASERVGYTVDAKEVTDLISNSASRNRLNWGGGGGGGYENQGKSRGFGKKGQGKKGGEMMTKSLTGLGSAFLQSGANSWAAQQKKIKTEASNEDEEISRKLKSYLNKLSAENFDRIYQQMTECGITTSNQVEILMKEVFTKATSQHFFIDLYTKLTLKLSDYIKEKFSEDEINFKRILLNECQDVFENNLLTEANITASADDAELQEKQFKKKNCVLGNIKFVGQLLVNNMLAKLVCFHIAEDLLQRNTDFTLECLCVLLTTVGKHFDKCKDEELRKDKKAMQFYMMLTSTFHRLQTLLQNSGVLKPRTKFMVMDLVDLRERGWER